MVDSKKESLARLEAIAAVLGVSVDQFFARSVPDDVVAANECLRLWGSLKTVEGREQP